MNMKGQIGFEMPNGLATILIVIVVVAILFSTGAWKGVADALWAIWNIPSTLNP